MRMRNEGNVPPSDRQLADGRDIQEADGGVLVASPPRSPAQPRHLFKGWSIPQPTGRRQIFEGPLQRLLQSQAALPQVERAEEPVGIAKVLGNAESQLISDRLIGKKSRFLQLYR